MSSTGTNEQRIDGKVAIVTGGSRGIGFGIAYAMLAPRRHWRWGVAWALLLETATVVTPFAKMKVMPARGPRSTMRAWPLIPST